MSVAVAIPHYRCHAFVARAVESILAQTHCDLVVVVVSDGDPVPPWAELEHLRGDRRLVTVHSPDNVGLPELWYEAVRLAIGAPFFAIQDADDASRPARLERLLAAIGGRAPGASSHIGGDYGGQSHTPARRRLGPTFRHRRCHAGLWRSADLDAVGGYFGGLPIRWDSMVVHAMSLLGEQRGTPMPHVDEVLYEVTGRPESVTRRPEAEPLHRAASGVCQAKWSRMWEARARPDLRDVIHHEMTSSLTEVHRARLARGVDQIRQALEARR